MYKKTLKNSFLAPELGFENENKVYINLSQTRVPKILWAATRNFKEAHDYGYLWITNAGKIFVKKKEGARPVLISENAHFPPQIRENI